MSKPSASYLDLLSRIAAFLGTVTLFVGFTGTVFEWGRDPHRLLVASVVGYAVLAGGVFWFAFKSSGTSPKWRWGSLAALYAITIPFFGWVGARISTLPTSSWPSSLVTYYDFETDADLTGWQGEIRRSDEHAFSGQYALRSTQPVQADQETKISLRWQRQITADVIVGQVYWPEDEDVGIEWAQVCIPLSGWACAGIPKNRGGWNTVVLDLSEMTVGDPPKPLDELILPGLHFQGRLRGAAGTSVTTLPMYVDAIQIYRDGEE